MRFTFEAHGERLIEREILRMGDHALDMRPAFEFVAQAMMELERWQFDTQGARGSGGWAPLKLATSREKARKGEDPRILHASRALEHSLTDQGDANQRLEIHESWMVFGSTLPYAPLLQSGTSKMEQRRPIDFTEPDRQGIVKIIQRWIMLGEVGL